MAVETPPTPLGSPLIDVELPDVHGRHHRLSELADGQPLLVAFVCNHCPYVKHIEDAFGEVTAELQRDGLRVVAVCANDTDAYPDDAPPRLAEQAERAGWDFPYLVDTDQTFTRRTGAACTPDLFLYDRDLRLAYRGAFDASSPGNGLPLTGEDLRAAATAVLAGQDVPEPHRPSMGCGIKWRA